MKRILLLGLLLAAGCGALFRLSAAAPDEDARIRAGFFAFPGYHEINSAGEKSGYGYEFLQRLSSYTGWHYEYVGYDRSWDDMVKLLESGAIDLVSGAVKTPERMAKFAYSSRPVGTSYSSLTVKAGCTRFLTGDYGSWSGMRVGMLRYKNWNDAFAAFAARKGFTFTPVYFEDIETMGQALQNGEVDALLSSSLRRPRNEWIYERFAPQPFYVMVRADNTALLEKINAALEQLALDAPLLADELMGRYYAPDLNGIPYSVEERRFIEQARAEKRVFHALLNPDRPPFAEYRDGEFHGILVDIAKRIVERTGLDIRLQKLSSREEYVREVFSGRTELLFDAWYDYSNAEKRGFHLTSPYFYSAVSRIRLKSFTGEPKSVAVVGESHVMAGLRRYGRPKAEIVTYNTIQEVIGAVREGRQDAGYINALTAETALLRDSGSDLTFELVPGMTTSYSAGIRYGADPLLVSIITKAVGSLPQTEVDAVLADFNARRPQVFSLWGWISVNPVKSLTALATVLLLVIFGLSALLLARRRGYRLARLVARLPMRYFVVDRSGQILLHSGVDDRVRAPAFSTLEDIGDPKLRELMRESISAALDSGEPQTVNFREDDSWRTGRITKLPHSFFHRECVVWVSQDTSELQEAREEAWNQAERFRLTLQSIGDAVLVTDRDGNVTLLNSVAERLTGWSLADARGKRHEEIFRIESFRSGMPVPSPLRQALQTGGTVEPADHTDLITRDGTHCHIADCAAPIHDGAGEIIGAILIFRDVTAEYENSDRLARARTSLEYASELTRSAAFGFEIGQNLLTGSNLLAELWPGRNGKFMSPRRWVRREDVPGLIRTYREVRSKALREAVVEFRTDFFGATRYYRMKASLDRSEPQNPKIIGVLQDITEQTLLIENQRVLNHCLEAFFEASDMQQAIRVLLETIVSHMRVTHCYILRTETECGAADTLAECAAPECAPFLLGRSGLPFDRNTAGSRLLLDRQPVLLDDLSRPEQLERLSAVRELCRERGVRSIFIVGIYLDGVLWGELGLVYEKCRANAFSELDLKFLRSAAHMIELLLLRERAAEHLKEAVAQAQAADRAKSFFLASMSHEIRTPLNAVIGFSELLKDGALPAAVQQDYLAAISSAGNALLALINDVLDLSKLEADQMVFSPVETDFAALVHEVESIFRQKSGERGLYLRDSMPPELPRIDLDTLRVRQILFNLVGNAVKFTEKGGIDIIVEFCRETADTGTLIFRVADTGIGISEADRKLLFQPFVQSAALRGTHAANNGTGLGLVIVDRMLRKMNGSIELASEPGRGSVFTVTIRDLRYRAAGPAAAREAAGETEVASVSVLLADDVQMNLKVMAAMLHRLGIEAVTVDNGFDALAVLERRTFDFLFTDLWMPGMSGEELARRVRESGRCPEMRIIAVTADVENRENFDMTLFDGVLSKPVTVESVRRILPVRA
ncbi:MAG: transporter substrate-binding domain-containing protein [Lentisphaeria bacterium]|nr:transporter substrate-binding domain-containing protein [Lentisphaeria bacterium]